MLPPEPIQIVFTLCQICFFKKLLFPFEDSCWNHLLSLFWPRACSDSRGFKQWLARHMATSKLVTLISVDFNACWNYAERRQRLIDLTIWSDSAGWWMLCIHAYHGASPCLCVCFFFKYGGVRLTELKACLLFFCRHPALHIGNSKIRVFQRLEWLELRWALCMIPSAFIASRTPAVLRTGLGALHCDPLKNGFVQSIFLFFTVYFENMFQLVAGDSAGFKRSALRGGSLFAHLQSSFPGVLGLPAHWRYSKVRALQSMVLLCCDHLWSVLISGLLTERVAPQDSSDGQHFRARISSKGFFWAGNICAERGNWRNPTRTHKKTLGAETHECRGAFAMSAVLEIILRSLVSFLCFYLLSVPYSWRLLKMMHLSACLNLRIHAPSSVQQLWLGWSENHAWEHGKQRGF